MSTNNAVPGYWHLEWPVDHFLVDFLFISDNEKKMRQHIVRRVLFSLAFLCALLVLSFTVQTASAAVSVTGKITLPDGATGVQGASINIHDNSWSVYQSTTTGSDGSFTLNDLPTCTCVIQVYANHASYADPDDTAIAVSAGQTVAAGTIKLAAHNVIGKLTAPDGVTGLSSLGVALQSADATFYRWASTDSTGQFRFRAPSAGTYTLRINSDYTSGNQTLYFPPADTTVTVTDTAQTLNIGSVAMKNPNVTGTVTEADGTTPVASAYVNIHSANWTISRSATTPSNGSFALFFPVGQYTLEVSLPGSGGSNPVPVTFTVTSEASGAALGTIRRTAPNIFFKVLKKNGTTPVSSASVSFHNALWTVSRSTSTAADGTASATVPAAGTYTVEVWANDLVESNPENFSFTYSSGNLYYDGTNGSQPILLQAPSVQGKVQKTDASAVVSATVYLSNSTNTVNKSATTDATGAFTLPAVATGTYTLQVTPPYGMTGLVGPDPVSLALTNGVTNTTYVASPLTLTQALKTITGKVTKPNGTAVANANINVWKNSGASGSTSTQTDAAGAYSLMVGSGDWFVTAYPMWTGSTSPDWGYFGSPSTVTFSQSNSVAESQTLNITVEAFTATVTGQVQNPDGTTPSAGTSVNVWKERGGWNSSSLDSGGNFTIKISPGTYNIEVFTNNWQYGTPELAPVTLKDGETKNMGILKLLTKNEFITGKVSDSNNQALSSQSVSCWKQRGGGYVSGTTNSTGQYSVSVSQGIWECDAWPTFYSYGQGADQVQYSRTQDPQEVSVNTKETKRDVNFVFAINDATINGTIQNEAGQVITDMSGWVQAANADTSSNSARYNNPGGDVQSGRFSIHVPAGTYDLGIWLPYQAGYTAKSEKTVTVASGSTVNNAVITVVPNNATLRGQVKDASGNVLTSVSGSVYATNGASGHQWANITNGSYSLALSAGEWRIGYWVDPFSGYLSQPLGEKNKATLTANATTTYDMTLLKLDSTVSGTVKDPDGNPLPNAWISIDTELGGKKKQSAVYDMYGGMFNHGTYTDSDGKFTMQVPGGSYFVTATTSTAFGYISPRAQEITVSPTTPATLSFGFLRPDATITGTVFLDTVSTQSFRSFRAFSSQTSPAYVSAWSNSGGFVEQFTNTGEFSLNITKGDEWHLKGVYTSGSTIYRSSESVVTVGASGTVKEDITLKRSALTLPTSETVTFPSTITTVMELDDGTTITMPQSSLTSTSANVTVTATPEAQLPNQANANVLSIGYGLDAVYASGSDSGKAITSFPQDITIEIPYTNAQLEEAGITETQLEPKYWDGASGLWKPVENVVVNTDKNTAAFTTDHFTSFALVTSASGSVAPTVALTSPVDGIVVRKNRVTVTGSVTDANATVTLSLNGGTAQGLTVQSTGSFSTTLTSLRAGSNTITLSASNSAGTGQVVTRTVVLSRASKSASADRIVVTPRGKDMPRVIVTDGSGKILANFLAFPKNMRMGLKTIVTDLNNDGYEEIIAVPGPGYAPQIRIFSMEGKLLGRFYAFNSSLRTGINVIAADIDGDGQMEIIAAQQTGGRPTVRIFNQRGKIIRAFAGAASRFRGGLNLASGDIDGDREAELLITAQKAGTSTLRIYDGNAKLIGAFLLYNRNVRGGFQVTTGDVDGDGKDDIITVPGKGLGPQIRVFSGKGKAMTSFFALASSYRGGMSVSTGDLTGDGKAEIVTSPLQGSPNIRVFNQRGKATLNFFAFPKTFRGSFTTVTTDLNGDGYAEMIVAPGPGFSPQVRIFSRQGKATKYFFSHGKTLRGGITVSVND